MLLSFELLILKRPRYRAANTTRSNMTIKSPLDASARNITLVDLFEPTFDNFGAPAAAVILTGAALVPLQTALFRELSYFPWKSFVGSLGTKAMDLLRTRLSDILVGTLQKSREILEYRDRAKHPPQEAATVPLFDRTFTSEHHPALEILFRESRYEVVFDVDLRLAMKGLILEIENAQIKAVHSGSLEGSGSISLWGVDLLKKQFPSVMLPGIVKLGRGIAI
jgi:hypothetical protein